MTKIILVDDHQVILDGLSVLLPTCLDCKIMATCLSGEQAIKAIKRIDCDVIIMDIFMHGKYGGIQATRIIKEYNPKVKILALSMLGDATTVNAMLTSGADGYLVKNASGKEIKEGIETVMAGHTYIHKELIQYFIDGVVNGRIDKSRLLSEMEIEVLRCLSQGKTSKETSEYLFRSEETIRTHRKNLLKKFRVKNTAEMVAYAVRNQLI